MGKRKRRRKKKRRGKKYLELTEDLTTDIISRLPEKDLMRFTCVSKSWRSLINTNDSYLSRIRSQRTILQGRPSLIIQKSKHVSRDKIYYNYWLELDSIEDGNPNPRQLRNPFSDDDHDCPCPQDACVIATCDGLLVLQQLPRRKMVVLNPTTKKHHVVPPNPAGDHNVVFMGFGYDHVHGCYKLVTKIVYSSSHDRALELMIYNVSNYCTWKKSRFDGLADDCLSKLSDSGKCVDGALYWCRDAEVLCFVLAEEEFHEVDRPDFDDVAWDSSVTVFDGRLCYCLRSTPSDKDRVEFWLMERDYKRQLGSSYSPRWIEFLVIPDLENVPPRPFIYDDLIPICFSACENKILFIIGDRQLFWYDVGKKEFRELKGRINEHSYNVDVHVIVPSLVGIGIS